MERMAWAVGWQLNASNNAVVGLYNDSPAPWVIVVMQVSVGTGTLTPIFGYLRQGFNPTVGENSLVQQGQYVRSNRGKAPGATYLDDIVAPFPQWLFEFYFPAFPFIPTTPAPIAILDPGWSLAIEHQGGGGLEAAFYYACLRPEELDPSWTWGETE